VRPPSQVERVFPQLATPCLLHLRSSGDERCVARPRHKPALECGVVRCALGVDADLWVRRADRDPDNNLGQGLIAQPGVQRLRRFLGWVLLVAHGDELLMFGAPALHDRLAVDAGCDTAEWLKLDVVVEQLLAAGLDGGERPGGRAGPLWCFCSERADQEVRMERTLTPCPLGAFHWIVAQVSLVKLSVIVSPAPTRTGEETPKWTFMSVLIGVPAGIAMGW
jgi:hypothetical protein